MTDTIPILNIHENFLRRFRAEGVRSNDGVVVEATGLALEVRVAASETGAAIGTLTTDAAEYVDDDGFYHADFSTADLVTHLADLEGKLVYVIVKKVGGLDCVWWVYRVATSREAT